VGSFDTIPHSELLTSVARRVSDGKMLHLIKMWLKAPVEETDNRGNRWVSGGKKATRERRRVGWLWVAPGAGDPVRDKHDRPHGAGAPAPPQPAGLLV